MKFQFRVSGWLIELLMSEKNRSKVIRQALIEYYERRQKKA